jgi:hypothetical protein
MLRVHERPHDDICGAPQSTSPPSELLLQPLLLPRFCWAAEAAVLLKSLLSMLLLLSF